MYKVVQVFFVESELLSRWIRIYVGLFLFELLWQALQQTRTERVGAWKMKESGMTT